MTFKRYETRFQAGQILAGLINKEDSSIYDHIKSSPKNFFCFAIPNGGVPVSEGFCNSLNLNYDVLIVRKIKIPWNTEAGFGSITTDGTVLINQPLFDQLNLTEKQLNNSIELTKQEIKDRLQFYNKESNLEEIYKENVSGKHVFMLDDGLASGFTMLAAIKMVKKYNPEKILIAVPTAPLNTVKRIKNEVHKTFCPNIRNVWRFAVAEAYKRWYDVPESEVLEIINKSKFYIK